MNARQIIEQEVRNPYDADDPLEKPEIPLGFNAKLPDGDEVEFRFDPQARGYRFSKWWNDPHTRKREALRNGALFPAQDYWAFVDSEMKRWSDAGWTVTPLEQ